MTSLNHAMTGALVAVAIKQPAIALPAAFLSHFLIDMIPHWNWQIKSAQLRRTIMISDMVAAIILLFFVALATTVSPYLVVGCGLLAISPDLMWLPHILTGKPSKMSDRKKILHKARRFHSKIQFSETSKGILVEAVWFILVTALIINTA